MTSRTVPITSLKPGTTFDLNGLKGQLVEIGSESVKVFVKEKPNARGPWKWREATWPKEMRVIPG